MDEAARQRLLDQFLEGTPPGRQADLLKAMMETVFHYAEDNAPVNELKLVSRSMREMRYAGTVFRKYADRRKVAVFGSARTRAEEPDFQLAREFARRIVEENFMIITGGGDGIMGAAQQGAGAEKSFGLNIRLPFEQHPNPVIAQDPKLINFNYFFARKLSFVNETSAFVLFPEDSAHSTRGSRCLRSCRPGRPPSFRSS